MSTSKTFASHVFYLSGFKALRVQGQSLTLSSGSSYAAIDTGTTLVGGPSSMIASLYSQIPGSAAATGEYDGYYTYREYLFRRLLIPERCLTLSYSLRYRSVNFSWLRDQLQHLGH